MEIINVSWQSCHQPNHVKIILRKVVGNLHFCNQPLFFCQVKIWWENVPMDVGLIGLCSAVLIMMVAGGYIWLCRKQKYRWSWETRQEGREISALFFTFIDWGRPGRHVTLGYRLAEFRQSPVGPQLYGRGEGRHTEVEECPALEEEELGPVLSVQHTGWGWQRRWWRGWGSSSSSSPPGRPQLGNRVRLSWWRSGRETWSDSSHFWNIVKTTLFIINVSFYYQEYCEE